MKTADLRALTREELEARIAATRRQVFDLRVKKATGQLEDAASIRRARRDVARALTVRKQGSRSE